MSLQDELDELAKRISSFYEPPAVGDEEWKQFADNTVVALMAGGEGTRYEPLLKGEALHKNVHLLPNGDTMIEMTIRQYRDVGITNFVAMVRHHAHSIEDRLGDGSGLGVHLTYCQDPVPANGKSGAICNAVENGSFPLDKYLIVVNPDDIVLDFPEFGRHIGEAHLEGEKKGMLTTAVLAPGQAFASTGMMVTYNKVIDTQMYPMIPVPAHVGITIFSPRMLPRFKDLIDLSQKSDFEKTLFPVLAQEGTLWSASLTKGTWIAVNNPKTYKELVDHLAKEQSS